MANKVVADSAGFCSSSPKFSFVGDARNIITLNNGGYISAGEDCHTNVEGIFVAGDCRNKTVRQLTTAVGDGSVAALAAIDYLGG